MNPSTIVRLFLPPLALLAVGCPEDPGQPLSPSPSAADTPTASGTPTAGRTPTGTATAPPTPSASPTAPRTPTVGDTPTAEDTPTATGTGTPTVTSPPASLSPDLTPTASLPPTATPGGPTVTPGGPTATPNGTPTATQPLATSTVGSTPTLGGTPTGGTPTVGTPTVGDTPTATSTPGSSPTVTGTPTTPTPIAPTPTLPGGPTPLDRPVAAWVITRPADLMTGMYAQGRRGDVMMANGAVRIIVQQPGRDIGWGLFGGNVIDVALVGADGAIGGDLFGEMSPFMNLSHGVNVSAVQIVDDGSVSGRAVVAAEGQADVFDILALQAAVEDIGITLPYDMSGPLPLAVRTVYTLEANSRRLEVATTLTNQSGSSISLPVGDVHLGAGDVEVYTPNPTGVTYSVTLDGETTTYSWGGFEEPAFSISTFLGFYGENGAYGYMPPLNSDGTPDFFDVTIGGVSVTNIGTTSLLDVFLKVDRNLFTVPAGRSATYSRNLFFGKDIGQVSDGIYTFTGAATGKVAGRVTEEGSGAPLAGVRLGFVAGTNVDAPVTAAVTDADGRYEIALPAGSYGALAAEGFDFVEVGRPLINTPVAFQVRRAQTTTRDLTMAATGRVHLIVRDGDHPGALLPARAVLYGDYQQPHKAVMDVADDGLPGGGARIRWAEQGDDTFAVTPGTYTLRVGRGFEYELADVPGVVVTANQTTEVEVTLHRVLETPGWMSADLHVHGFGSPDSSVVAQDRARIFAGEGVDILVSTDHDYVMDYAPAIRELGLESELMSLVGIESTTFDMGHFNVFPLTVDPESRTGGAMDHADGHYAPLDLETGDPVDLGISTDAGSDRDNLAAWQVFKAYERSQPGEQVRQVNHGRGDLGGNFSVIGLDLSQWGTEGITQVDPTVFRVAEGTPLFDPGWMSAMEIMNGTGMGGTLELMNDWFGFLNLGFDVTGTGVSDTHSRIKSEAGYARTYVRMPYDTAWEMSLDPDKEDTFAAAVNGRHATIASGLFLEVEAYGDGDEGAGPGDLCVADGAGQVNLRVRLQAPTWSGISTLYVFNNSVVEANLFDSVSLGSMDDLAPVLSVAAGAGLDVVEVPVHAGVEGGPRRLEAVFEEALTVAEDGWIVVAAVGPGGVLRAAIDSGNAPVAISNPIYVDADGDGTYTAPGPAYILPPPAGAGERRIPSGPACAHRSGHNPPEVWKAIMDSQR